MQNLLARYAEHADELDAAGIGKLLAQAEVTFAGAVLRDRDQITAHYERLFAEAPRSRHLLANFIVDIPEAASAVARCRYSRWTLYPDAELAAVGDYRAEFTLDPWQGWRFAKFSVSRTWQR